MGFVRKRRLAFSSYGTRILEVRSRIDEAIGRGLTIEPVGWT
ncbi:hypothetical protein RSSM_06754 [Rhodopirellula sallentina SM41]|uniref:Uncharacterized protein n=1 Tax=Rhodopirellula sallentina SM41 TaxID=1263870 RepID=M5TRK7_9BACT|nr:hypothetical protein RSSM_06754 [Rhodopirellula sallentina SM41]